MKTPLPTPPPPTVEESINTFVANSREAIHRRLDKCEGDIRHAPLKSVLTAAAAGYFLHRLPVRSIVMAHVRLATALIPPALFLFGSAKVYDFMQRQAAAEAKPH